MGEAGMGEPSQAGGRSSDVVPAARSVELTEGEMELVRTALRLLESTLGREEADELAEVQSLLRRLSDAGRR